MSLANRKVVHVDHNSRNLRSMQHHLLLQLHPETEVSIVTIARRTSRLDRLNLKVVCHKEVVGFLRVVNVVATNLADVVMVTQVAINVVNRVTL